MLVQVLMTGAPTRESVYGCCACESAEDIYLQKRELLLPIDYFIGALPIDANQRAFTWFRSDMRSY